VRRITEDHRRDRRAGGDREDPHALGLGRAGAAARTGAGALARPRGLTRVQSDGSAAEPTGVFSLPSREGVKARRLKADSVRCRVRIVTARGCSSPVSARLSARSTGEYIAGVRKTSFEIPIRWLSQLDPLQS
jgi:hypothetical protein